MVGRLWSYLFFCRKVWILFRLGFLYKSILLDFWRHTRAMHLYQHGMDLTLVSQWLGHAQLETTLIYAHADTEHKRKAIGAAVPDDSPLKNFVNPAHYRVTDDEMLKRLYGLR